GRRSERAIRHLAQDPLAAAPAGRRCRHPGTHRSCQPPCLRGGCPEAELTGIPASDVPGPPALPAGPRAGGCDRSGRLGDLALAAAPQPSRPPEVAAAEVTATPGGRQKSYETFRSIGPVVCDSNAMTGSIFA